ncbi:S9 family peptidase [Roseateles violae]|uniref:Prolyl oligopeptidase family serine peptidase n=1 Tax=Roseateles violae TaxID=3058042 RepID=A0ABT8DT94_9BURK|nr:alpha/beta fold hydrolase [Pelomonas sp. PFR6]MDN3921291.1 prolyl oligopeptidase family serine peptidase [Pelomonas sp. PFR6]
MTNRRSALALLAGTMTLGRGPLAAPAEAGAPAAYTAEDFAAGPLLRNVQLSPDGKRFAAILNKGKHSFLVTRAVAGGAFTSLLASDNLEFQFNWLRWINPQRLAVSLRYPSDRQVSEFSSADTMESRLLSVSADKPGDAVNLSRPRGEDDVVSRALQQDRVVDWLPEDGQHILLALPDTKFSQQTAVYKVHVISGARRIVQESLPRVSHWLSDAQHRVRVGIAYEQGRLTLWACDPQGQNWRALRSFGFFDERRVAPLGFGLDPNLLYLQAQHEGLWAVHTLDLSAADPQPQLKYRLPAHDLDARLLHSSRNGDALGLVTNGGAADAYVWDTELKALAERLDRALPQRQIHLQQLVADDQIYLLRTWGNGNPGEYAVGNRAQGSLTLLSEVSPQLDPARLTRKQRIEFKARDGLPLQAFLSLPRGVPGSALPLVVLPHGGPQSADTGLYDTWSAFIAARGYAVLQVNFRGSTGSGQKHLQAGLRRWGLEMQDDLEDGVAELVRRGTADPKRVAIAGSSYGGYAALMGAVKTPGLYRGAFAFAPVTDLVDLIRESENFRTMYSREAVAEQIGTLADDRARLEATSPRRQAARIEVPVVLLHGTLDRSVPFEQGQGMADALKAAGKDLRFVKQERGDHFLSHQPHRLQFFQELEGFLARVLGPGALA